MRATAGALTQTTGDAARDIEIDKLAQRHRTGLGFTIRLLIGNEILALPSGFGQLVGASARLIDVEIAIAADRGSLDRGRAFDAIGDVEGLQAVRRDAQRQNGRAQILPSIRFSLRFERLDDRAVSIARPRVLPVPDTTFSRLNTVSTNKLAPYERLHPI